jgi:hypothetical protein
MKLAVLTDGFPHRGYNPKAAGPSLEAILVDETVGPHGSGRSVSVG